MNKNLFALSACCMASFAGPAAAHVSAEHLHQHSALNVSVVSMAAAIFLGVALWSLKRSVSKN